MIEDFPGGLSAEARLKRARMRAWRRGMREMDLILGGFIDSQGPTLDADALTAFEALLARRDQDLYLWVCRRGEDAPADAGAAEIALIQKISADFTPSVLASAPRAAS